MMSRLSGCASILALFLTCFAHAAQADEPYTTLCKSIRDFGVLSANSAAENKAHLQAAIDWASPRGAALFVTPSSQPYPVDGGLVLKKNVSLVGVHGPVGRGTRHPTKAQPVGSVFQITDERRAFITMESATQLRGIQFWYPKQTLSRPENVIKYPPTVRVSQTSYCAGMTLSCLTFMGEYMAMDFDATAKFPCEQILFEDCYGYPLGGEFIRINHCYDIPRLLHCHVNPCTQRLIKGDYTKAVVDAVVARKTFSYAINHTDNAQVLDIFAFGVYGGIELGPDTYGQLTNFNFDCVTIGINKEGSNAFNRNWQIAQGSIIATAGSQVSEIHPIIADGQGHISLSNVECFSGINPALSSVGQSQDYLMVKGDQVLTVSLSGCRMQNYAADLPITNLNPHASIQAVACVDKHEKLFNQTIEPKSPP